MRKEELISIKDILNEAFGRKNIGLEKLAELTDIPERYLAALYQGDYYNLPAQPYVHGYLMKIGEVLGIDADGLWQIYKKNLALKTSGGTDKLPYNRFAFKKISKKKIVTAVLILAILGFFAINIGRFLGIPSINITSPSLDGTIVNNSNMDLTGKINPKDKLTINGEDVPVDGNGDFDYQFLLQPGPNSIEFKVKRLLGKTTTVTRQVIYQAQ